MSSAAIQNLLHDVVAELVEMSKDKSLWEAGEFNQGRLSSVHQMLMLVEREVEVFEVKKAAAGLGDFDVAAWFRLGPKYWQSHA